MSRMSRRSGSLVAILAAAVAALVVLTLLSTGGSSTNGAGDPSSRNAGRDGTLALYEWLGDLGLDVHRVSGDFDLTSTDVLVVAAPSESFTDDEVARLDAFLQRGGVLLLAASPETLAAAQPFLDHLHLGVDRATPPGSATPVGRIDRAGNVHSVDFADTGIDVGNAGTPLLRLNDDRVVLSSFSVGPGSAYILGSPYPLSNEGLRVTRPDSAGVLQPTGSDADALVLALLERTHPASGDVLRVAFDEVHHGEGSTGGLGAILVSPLGLALLLVLLVVVAWLATSGRRMGRPIPAGDPSAVPTAATFVRAMAQLYERSAHRGAVADRYAAELKDRVSAASGVDPHLDDAAFVAALHGYGEERAAEVGRTLAWARSLAARMPADAELLALARAVDSVEARWTAGAAV
jgi:hypothetical protein